MQAGHVAGCFVFAEGDGKFLAAVFFGAVDRAFFEIAVELVMAAADTLEHFHESLGSAEISNQAIGMLISNNAALIGFADPGENDAHADGIPALFFDVIQKFEQFFAVADREIRAPGENQFVIVRDFEGFVTVMLG